MFDDERSPDTYLTWPKVIEADSTEESGVLEADLANGKAPAERPPSPDFSEETISKVFLRLSVLAIGLTLWNIIYRTFGLLQ